MKTFCIQNCMGSRLFIVDRKVEAYPKIQNGENYFGNVVFKQKFEKLNLLKMRCIVLCVGARASA